MQQINFFKLFSKDTVGKMVVDSWAKGFTFSDFCGTYNLKIYELDYYIDEEMFNKMYQILDDQFWNDEKILNT